MKTRRSKIRHLIASTLAVGLISTSLQHPAFALAPKSIYDGKEKVRGATQVPEGRKYLLQDDQESPTGHEAVPVVRAKSRASAKKSPVLRLVHSESIETPYIRWSSLPEFIPVGEGRRIHIERVEGETRLFRSTVIKYEERAPSDAGEEVWNTVGPDLERRIGIKEMLLLGGRFLVLMDRFRLSGYDLSERPWTKEIFFLDEKNADRDEGVFYQLWPVEGQNMQFVVILRRLERPVLEDHTSARGWRTLVSEPERASKFTFQIASEPTQEPTVDDLPSDPSQLMEVLMELFPMESFPKFVGYWNILSAMKRYAGPLRGKHILEIGPGYPYSILGMKKLGLDIQGLESNPSMARAAKERGLNVLQGSITDPPQDLLEGKRFDITFSRLVLDVVGEDMEPDFLERIAKPGFRPNLDLVKAALLQMARLTRPGGLSIHEVSDNWGLTDQDFMEVGFEILEGSAADRFVVLRRKSMTVPISGLLEGATRLEESA